MDRSYRWQIPRAVIAVLLLAYLSRGCSDPTFPDPNDPWPGFVSMDVPMILSPIADTYVATGVYHGYDIGDGTTHNNGICPTLFVGSNCDRTKQSFCRSLISFDFSDIESVDSAYLDLYCMQASPGSPLVTIDLQIVEHDPDSLVALMGNNCCSMPLSPMMTWGYLAYDNVAWNDPGCGAADVSDSVLASFDCDSLGWYRVNMTDLVNEAAGDVATIRLKVPVIGMGINIKEFWSLESYQDSMPRVTIW